MSPADLVGSWRLLSCEHRAVGGGVEHPFGPNPAGRLIYDAGGHMNVVLVDSRRARFKSHQLFESTDAELADSARGCVAYTGKWRLEEGKVIHKVDAALFPNWIGGALVRYAALEGNRLTLSTGEFTINGKPFTAALVWEKEA